MQKISINNSKSDIPIGILFWEGSSDRIILLVGGSGDRKDTFIPLVNKLRKENVQDDIISFSFRYIESKKYRSFRSLVEDLKEILDWVKEEYGKKVIIICTSIGAYSTTHVMIDPKYSKIIDQVIFVDPADYYIDMDPAKGTPWSGDKKYKPKTKTAVSLLKEPLGNIRVHVVNLTLRNYTKIGYTGPDKRHEDNPSNFPRLSDEMVKNFYKNVSVVNRGKYIENNSIPHGFMRDGDIKRNVKNLSNILKNILLS